MDNPCQEVCAPERATIGNIPVSFETAQIKKCSNGFVIGVGCKTFVFKSWAEVAEALDLYFRNPYEARKKYCLDEVTA